MSELMGELRELISTMCKLLGDNNGIDMDETCGTEELHKTRKVWHGQNRTEDTQQREQSNYKP